MPSPVPRGRVLSGRILAACLVAGATPLGASTPSAAFRAENDAAMVRMHAAMQIQPTGDVDRDFVAMMIPHHQGGIDMAVAVLRHSKNERVRRLAQEIIVTQQQEIAALRLAIGEPPPPSTPSLTRPPSAEDAEPPSSHHQATPGV